VCNTNYGHAAREIVDEAKAHDAGVIVMGSRGLGDLAGLVLGSTAHKVTPAGRSLQRDQGHERADLMGGPPARAGFDGRWGGQAPLVTL
jgi:Universal stress protein family